MDDVRLIWNITAPNNVETFMDSRVNTLSGVKRSESNPTMAMNATGSSDLITADKNTRWMLRLNT